MKQKSNVVRFITPAFLGNAEQAGQWRTPPFKALLRQWWRVAVAQEMNFDTKAMREREGKIFGTAADNKESRKSQVRLRFSHWNPGTLSHVPDIGQVSTGRMSVPAALYSGYGPVKAARPRPVLNRDPAIQPGAEVTMHLAFPQNQGVEQALALMDAFATAGGRSRNGWGSFALVGEKAVLDIPTRDWIKALELDWPHALGEDAQGPLIWRSKPLPSWENAMRLLAQTRADMRRSVPDRRMLAYPDTKSRVPEWSGNARVPNSLRFKVRAENNQFFATVFHTACRPANELWEKLPPDMQKTFVDTFSAAHNFLDNHTDFDRTGGQA